MARDQGVEHRWHESTRSNRLTDADLKQKAAFTGHVMSPLPRSGLLQPSERAAWRSQLLLQAQTRPKTLP
jgi:hypothetical protein